MIHVVLFGPPGSGKGTQAKLLAEKFKLTHISTGDLFRENIQNATELGKLAQSYMNKGQLVPDEVTSNMLKDFLQKHHNPKGYIFDGYPRTIPQAQTLDGLLQELFSSEVTIVLSLSVPDDILVQRLLNRGLSSGRSDDASEEVIQNRIQEYYAKTNPVAEFYKSQQKWQEINGVGEVSAIFQKLSKKIDALVA